MRAYLHRIGIHLKPTTTIITIPERSFIRAGHDQYADEVIKKAEQVLPDVIHGTMTDDMYCRMVGEMLSSKIKKYAVDLDSPPNSGVTVQQKGSSNPLIDTGDMVNGITYKVEG